jgi:hypothetical protein
MKASALVFALLTVGLLLWLTAGSVPQSDNEPVYYIDLPADMDTLKIERSVTLDPSRKKQVIQFPAGGTATTVLIYDSTFLSGFDDQMPLARGSFKLGESVRLDITSLEKARYAVHYMSCNNGGVFPLTIK